MKKQLQEQPNLEYCSECRELKIWRCEEHGPICQNCEPNGCKGCNAEEAIHMAVTEGVLDGKRAMRMTDTEKLLWYAKQRRKTRGMEKPL